MVENDVIEHFDSEGFTGYFEFLDDFDVIFAGCDIAGGVVVGDDDDRGAVGYGIGKDLPWMNLGFIDHTDGDGTAGPTLSMSMRLSRV